MNARSMTKALNMRVTGRTITGNVWNGKREERIAPFWFSYTKSYLLDDKHIEELQDKEANVSEVSLKETGYNEPWPYYVRPSQLLDPEKFKTGKLMYRVTRVVAG